MYVCDRARFSNTVRLAQLDPHVVIKKLKVQIQELREELAYYRGGEGSAEPLTDSELRRSFPLSLLFSFSVLTHSPPSNSAEHGKQWNPMLLILHQKLRCPWRIPRKSKYIIRS